MTIGIEKWPEMRPPGNSIFLLSKRGAQSAKKHCAIGPSQKLDLKNHPGILAALRFVAGASATIGRQMLPALASGSKTSLDSIQTIGRPSNTVFRTGRNSLPCDRAARRQFHDLGLDRSSFGIRRAASPTAKVTRMRHWLNNFSQQACHAALLMLRYDPDDPGELSGALHGG